MVDQGSANGTFLDSQRVAEAVLRSGQEVRFGAVSFKVELEDDDLAATMVATPSPDATVVAPAHMMPTPPLGIPSSTPLGAHARGAGASEARGRTAAEGRAAPSGSPARARASAAPPGPAPTRRTPGGRSPAAGLAQLGGGQGPFRHPPGGEPGRAGPRPWARWLRHPWRRRRAKSPIVWMIAGCCGCLLLGMLAAAGIGGAAFFATQAPASAVQSHLAELRQGDLDAAYRRLAPELQAQLPPPSSSSW